MGDAARHILIEITASDAFITPTNSTGLPQLDIKYEFINFLLRRKAQRQVSTKARLWSNPPFLDVYLINRNQSPQNQLNTHSVTSPRKELENLSESLLNPVCRHKASEFVLLTSTLPQSSLQVVMGERKVFHFGVLFYYHFKSNRKTFYDDSSFGVR